MTYYELSPLFVHPRATDLLVLRERKGNTQYQGIDRVLRLVSFRLGTELLYKVMSNNCAVSFGKNYKYACSEYNRVSRVWDKKGI